MLGLRYFAMLCNNAEYKKMDQDISRGQLYDVQNKINILYKVLVGPTHLLRQKDKWKILNRLSVNKKRIYQCVKNFFFIFVQCHGHLMFIQNLWWVKERLMISFCSILVMENEWN